MRSLQNLMPRDRQSTLHSIAPVMRIGPRGRAQGCACGDGDGHAEAILAGRAGRRSSWTSGSGCWTSPPAGC